MRLGIGSYTYPWAIGVRGHPPRSPLTAMDLVERARAMGIRLVQFCDNLPLTSLSAAEMDQFKGRVADAGLTVEVGTRGIARMDGLLECLRLAVGFGAPFVRVVIDSPGDEPELPEVVRRLKPVVHRFADAGVKLAIENHDRFPARELVVMIEQLGPEHTGVCLDRVNSLGALEGPDFVVETLAPYTLNLHVKDFTISRVSSQMGFVVTGCPAGEGRLNLPAVLKQLRASGRDVNAILELWTPWKDTVEETMRVEAAWADRSVRYLRQHIPD